MIRYKTKISSTLLLFSIILISSITVNAQVEEPAEIVATIDTPDNTIPSIKVSEWTEIDIKVIDAFGINWSYLSDVFKIRAQYLWPVIHPTWKPFLGYTTLRFSPEIVEGDPRGWYMRVTPSAIPEADQGKIYILKLEVKTDDIAVDYAVVIGIRVTRVDTLGNDFGESIIYIPVKASSLNNIKMESTITTKEVAPRSFTHFDIIIKNNGYYRDMFKLEFEQEDGLKVAASKQLFVLDPGASMDLRIDVLTPEKFYDLGTPNRIEIYATSASDEEPVHIGTVVVITKGLYISPLIGLILAPIIIILLLAFFLFYHSKQKKVEQLIKKPEKPWNIPEEKKHLEELKKKDKEAYEKELTMMEDEYKSAMLWFEDHKQSILHKNQKKPFDQINGKITGFFKKPEQKKEKTEEKKPAPKQKDRAENGITKFFSKSEKKQKQTKKEKEPVKTVEIPEKKEEKPKETPEIIKDQYTAIKKRSAESERKKQIALEKIKRAQEKQKKKMK